MNRYSITVDRMGKARRSHAHRGAAFVVTLLVITVLTVVSLAFAGQMRTEALASSNHAAMVEAQWIARGALEAVRGALARSGQRDGSPSLDNLGVAAEPLGRGLYWLIRPGFDDDRKHTYGLTGEAGKLNINIATSESLVELPRMTDDIAAAIIDWRDQDSDLTAGGAESQYYLTLRDPYQAKDGPFETVGELMLVRGVDRELMYGEDINRSGISEANEDDGDGRLEWGLYDLVTVYSSQPNDEQININQPSVELAQLLQQTLTAERFATVAAVIPTQRPYSNTLDFFVRAQFTREEFEQLHGRVTTRNGQTLRGLVDAYAAPAQVLEALPGMDAGDGELIVAARPILAPGESPPSLVWLIDVLGEEKAVAVAGALTHLSFQFTADIVAVTGNGRGFCRLRAVLDATPADAGANSLPEVLYIQDLTSLGWPLEQTIRDRLRAGTAVEEVAAQFGVDGS